MTTPLRIVTGGAVLSADLGLPSMPTGLVVFAHGSGSSRHSSRNQFVAKHLEHAGFATLLADLLTEDEEAVDRRTAQFRFNIDLLADRVVSLVDWAAASQPLGPLPVGLFGASTGGAAALVAAARRPDRISAVVSRGGRPDLADAALAHVRAPTLLLVGGADEPVIALNEAARRQMTGTVSLVIVPGATHLFEEAGALERVADEAAAWFAAYLVERREPGRARA